MTPALREQLDRLFVDEGAGAALDALAEQFAAERRYHDRFDLRLVQARHELGLPLAAAAPLDDLPEPARTAMEEASLAACREAGLGLLAENKLREAWMYLRPTGERELLADALLRAAPHENNLNELVELALYEGLAPAFGFSLVLEHFGVCNAITTFESVVLARPRTQQQAAAALLVRRVHRDLLGNVRADIARQEGAEPRESTLANLVADREWLFAENNYHLDTTHLNATVRFARQLDDPEPVRLARDIAAYGCQLARQFQFAGEEPFVDVYPTHRLFFDALLGERVDDAVSFFALRAREANPELHGAAPVEVLISLLSRLGRHAAALESALTLFQPGMRTSGSAPSLLELAAAAGNFRPLLALAADREDWLTYLTGLIEQSRNRPGS